MKTTLLLAALAGLSYTLWVDFHPQAISAKSMSPASRLRSREQSARVERALAEFRRGAPTLSAETRATLAALPPGYSSRLWFAGLLEKRGETRAAFELMRPHVHFGEASTPIDEEMALYARLAERTGHPSEAAWARERMGPDGHFRNWRRSMEGEFIRRGSAFPTGRDGYIIAVNREVDFWLSSYPGDLERAEAFRRELLAAP